MFPQRPRFAGNFEIMRRPVISVEELYCAPQDRIWVIIIEPTNPIRNLGMCRL